MPDLYVGIDPSITNTGVTVLNYEGNVVSCFNSARRTSKLSRKTPFYKFLRLKEITDSIISFLHETIQEQKADSLIIAYEDYSYNSENFSFTMGEFNGVLKMRLAEEFERFILVEPTRVKKFATGAGTATKTKMVQQACRDSSFISRLPKADKTDDVCDAYFLAKIAWYFDNPKAACKFNTGHPLLRERLQISKTIYGGMNEPERSKFYTANTC